MSKIDPIQEFLQSLPMTDEVWTEEEAKMSTPYSDVATWRRILIQQLRSGESRFCGPPGLLEEMAARLSCTKGQEAPLPPST